MDKARTVNLRQDKDTSNKKIGDIIKGKKESTTRKKGEKRISEMRLEGRGPGKASERERDRETKRTS